MFADRARDLLFVSLILISAVVLYLPLQAVVRLSLSDYRYSHIITMPLVSAGILYLEKGKIFRECRFGAAVGVPLMLLGMGLGTFATAGMSGINNSSLAGGAVVLTWIGAFVLCYGTQTSWHARFSLLVLLLMVPIPSGILDRAVAVLQKASAEVSYALFRASGVPVLREGFLFSLPGVEIEIAEECSGIRSSVALWISSLLAGHVFLQTGWSKMLLVLMAIPIVIIKNAIRIVTITCLGVYLDRGFLYGALHRYSGLPFSLVAVLLLVAALMVLQKWELQVRKQAAQDAELSGKTKRRAHAAACAERDG